LLEEVARLSELKMKIAAELNAPGKTMVLPSAMDDTKDKEERERIKAYVRFQATELESLRAELNMLKRKEAPIFSYSAPQVPPKL
jgi:aromatic ring hydroxylase